MILRSRVLLGVFPLLMIFFFSHTSTFQLLDKPWSKVSSLPPPRFLPPICIAHRVQQSHCSPIFHRALLTHALAFFVSQFVRKKKSPRIYTSMHSGGFELTKLTCTRLGDNLIRLRGDRHYVGGSPWNYSVPCTRVNRIMLSQSVHIIIKIKIHSSCEIEDFVETHLCKLCVILRSRALRVVCPH